MNALNSKKIFPTTIKNQPWTFKAPKGTLGGLQILKIGRKSSLAGNELDPQSDGRGFESSFTLN